nr:hypothetical protein BaRGS_018681 [Batillaria attramentaria]
MNSTQRGLGPLDGNQSSTGKANPTEKEGQTLFLFVSFSVCVPFDFFCGVFPTRHIFARTQGSRGGRMVERWTSNARGREFDPRGSVNKLPPTYEDNIAGYERFVQDFGTHYISVGKWGGIMMMYLETNSSYSEKKTEQEVSAQAEATFNSVLTVKGGTSISNTEIDSEFTSSTRRHVSRKAAMEKAVLDYLMKTYLTVECKRMLGTLPSEMQSRPEVTKVMTDINYLVARRPMRQSSVDAVGKRTLDTYTKLFLEYDNQHSVYQWGNEYDGVGNFNCPAGKVITGWGGTYSEHYEDRRGRKSR